MTSSLRLETINRWLRPFGRMLVVCFADHVPTVFMVLKITAFDGFDDHPAFTDGTKALPPGMEAALRGDNNAP